MKRILIGFTAALLLAAAVWPVTVSAAAPLYEYKERTTLAKGVVYERNRQMTDAGMLDVHILTVPLSDPNIYIGPVDSQKELGLKETASALLSASGAIAGTNGDFFGLVGTHSVPFGPVTIDGQLKAASAGINATANEFAALFLDDNNYPFMRYMKTDIHFYNNNTENIEIASYNKISETLEWPVVIDRQVLTSTESLDARFPGLVKVVVNNNAISYVSQINEPVTIPQDGYVVIIPAWMADAYRSRFRVGDKAVLTISNNMNLDMSKIKASIGGGGLILSAGKTVHDDGTVIAGRQPRTAVGVTRDGKQLILMTVDGRSHSIGATHDEMAALLTTYGAYDAMHLDGGGSSTMVVKEPETDAYTVVNTVSDGAERRIVNALGVFDRSPVGNIQKLVLRLSQTHTFTGTPVEAAAYGQDAYLHSIPLTEDYAYTLDFIGPNGDTNAGEWLNGTTFLPKKAGAYTLRAYTKDGKLSATKTLSVHDIAELTGNPLSIRTLEGMTTTLDFSGIGTDGVQVPANNGVTVSVVPSRLGVVKDGVFTALSGGAGYLDCALNGVHTYVPLTVGGFAQPLNAFTNTSALTFSGYPATASGKVSLENGGVRPFARLDYQFKKSTDTQAAYMTFGNELPLPGEPLALRMQVYGDASGNWLRGRVKDAAGQTHNIDFKQVIDFTGWQTVTAVLPAGLAPYTLDRIYVAATFSDADQSGTLYFDNLEALYAPADTADVPKGATYADPLRADLSGATGSGVLDLTLSPKGMAYSAVKADNNTTVITLSAAKGGLYATDAKQWQKLSQDIKRINTANVIILMDKNPLRFTQPKEFELFQLLLASQKNYARKVFVVSGSSDIGSASCTMMDGVRYIDLPWYAAGGDVIIRFKTEGKQIWFDTGA